jgi:hypothetical protein
VVKKKTIYSKQKVIEYSVVSLLAGVTLFYFSGARLLPLILFCFLTRLAFYDALLNIFRGLPIYYEGVPDRKKSGVDWLESKLKIPIWLLRLLYIAAYIGYLLIYLL